MGPCPKCGGKVFEGPDSWICEKCQAEKRPCKFKISKVILQQPIDKAQATKLLKDGRSDLLKDFVSSKTGNKFGAYLVMDENGKANFEFPPRESLEEEQSRTE
jgi:DNA topoisomerase-3